MADFTPDDHDRLVRVETIVNKIAATQRRIPGRTAHRVNTQVSRKAAILIGVGVMLGSLLGNAGADVVRTLFLKLVGIH